MEVPGLGNYRLHSSAQENSKIKIVYIDAGYRLYVLYFSHSRVVFTLSVSGKVIIASGNLPRVVDTQYQ